MTSPSIPDSPPEPERDAPAGAPSPSSSSMVFMSEDFRKFVQCVLSGRCPGVFTTVSPDGTPHARWMGTLYNAAFPIIYALTSPHSRKLEELDIRSTAAWLFANADMSITLTFEGEAAQVFNPGTIAEVWSGIETKRHAYFLLERRGFAVIETVVRRVECSFPKSNYHTEISLEEFRGRMGLDLHMEAGVPVGAQGCAPSENVVVSD